MRPTVASLAAVLVVALAGCGGDGAEPDAPEGAGPPRELTLVLDFQPNAVHSGIYVAQRRGLLGRAGVALEVRVPGASTDAPRLLRSGRAELAILDIHDLAIARERGYDLVGVGAIVQRPLAAVIAADRAEVREPGDLLGGRIGVSGLPSDEAVLESILGSSLDGPRAPEVVTIGFDAVPTLSAGRVDAATAFWNAEGVALRELGVPTREFRLEDFGAPRYPELVVVAAREGLAANRGQIERTLAALREGYALTAVDPGAALEDLLAAVPELDRGTQRRQLEALEGAFDPPLELDPEVLVEWARWHAEHGIVEEEPSIEEAFDLEAAAPG
jgi:putative hydroxymethylpyrimidine transport system substrate-binding protein